MKCKEVLSLAANFAGSDLFNKIKDKNIESDLSDDERGELQVYLDALELIQDELANDYNLYTNKEEFKGGTLKFSDFKYKPIKILSVKSYGSRVRFRVYTDCLAIESNQVKVVYTYKPPTPKLDDEIEGLIPGRVIAYGIAREIALRDGLYEETEIWEGRFKDGVKMFLKRNGSIMRGRRWR